MRVSLRDSKNGKIMAARLITVSDLKVDLPGRSSLERKRLKQLVFILLRLSLSFSDLLSLFK